MIFFYLQIRFYFLFFKFRFIMVVSKIFNFSIFGGKMKLRKFLNVLLFSMIAMCLVFSLVGCSEKKNDKGSEGGSNGDPTDEKLYPYTIS